MRNIVGDYQWFQEGLGLLPLVEEVTLNDIKWKTEDFTGGGLAGTRSLKMILDKMEVKVKTSGYDPRVQHGVGQMPGVSSSYKLLASVIDPGADERPQKILVTGAIVESKRDSYKAGGKVMHEHTISDITYYEEWFDGKEVLAIDLLNQVLRVNGVDVMAQRRRNTGRL